LPPELRRSSRAQLIEQRLCVLQIIEVEALGEPAVDRGEQLASLGKLAPPLPTGLERYRGPQLPPFRFPFACDGEPAAVSSFGFAFPDKDAWSAPRTRCNSASHHSVASALGIL
jgi:hypothetical protein